ncbi:MAG: hypothetical protein LBC51_10965 [Treponema sp.]|jgi:hypothetical protein|nr:hypothetical protein [Treponema sp.]
MLNLAHKMTGVQKGIIGVLSRTGSTRDHAWDRAAIKLRIVPEGNHRSSEQD